MAGGSFPEHVLSGVQILVMGMLPYARHNECLSLTGDPLLPVSPLFTAYLNLSGPRMSQDTEL